MTANEIIAQHLISDLSRRRADDLADLIEQALDDAGLLRGPDEQPTKDAVWSGLGALG